MAGLGSCRFTRRLFDPSGGSYLVQTRCHTLQKLTGVRSGEATSIKEVRRDRSRCPCYRPWSVVDKSERAVQAGGDGYLHGNKLAKVGIARINQRTLNSKP